MKRGRLWVLYDERGDYLTLHYPLFLQHAAITSKKQGKQCSQPDKTLWKNQVTFEKIHGMRNEPAQDNWKGNH